jgi:hypothetical protein
MMGSMGLDMGMPESRRAEKGIRPAIMPLVRKLASN